MHTVDPETLGLSPARLRRLDAAMQALVDRGHFAGLVALIARRGAVAYLRRFGLADLEARRPMQPDTIFRIYSMTKPITSVALLMLYEEGLFQLNDPVSRFIPAFSDLRVYAGEGCEPVPLERPVTIRHLLTHTSGLSYPNPEGSPVERRMWQLTQERQKTLPEETLAEWLPRLLSLPLPYQPGTRFQYGYSTDVAGYLVELLSGLPFDAFLQQRIFEPLGMVDTGFWVPPARVDRLAAMYAHGGQGALELADPGPGGRYAQERRFFSGGGGLVSTPADYYRFAQMLLNEGELDGTRLLGRKTVELMTMNHLPPPPLPSSFGGDFYGEGYGFGLGVRVRLDVARGAHPGSLGEYGWAGYAGTDYWADPQEQMIGLFFPQLEPREEAPYPPALQFKTLAYQAVAD
jgi:CubicO group peptidase (beta-lactamase class C family)